MALTPINFEINTEADDEVETSVSEILPSLTYKLGSRRLGARIDGSQAVEQFIQKALSTVRSNYLIYDDSYGSDIQGLIKQSLPLGIIEVEVPRMIEDALIYDDRIEQVSNFVITQKGDALYVNFTVVLTNGESIDSEVIL